MIAVFVVLGEYVEEERLHVIIERFVVQKQLGEQAQILTIDLRNSRKKKSAYTPTCAQRGANIIV